MRICDQNLIISFNIKICLSTDDNDGNNSTSKVGKDQTSLKEIRDTKGTFHAKMGTIKDRNGMELTEEEDIKRWQEYTEELYKKIFMTQIIIMM